MPKRFDLSYVGPDNAPHRPVVIHRAILGSFERFIGILIEHYAGKFPVWLAPEQVRLLTVSEKSEDMLHKWKPNSKKSAFKLYGTTPPIRLGTKFVSSEFSCSISRCDWSKEQDNGTVAVACRDNGDLGNMSLEDFIAKLMQRFFQTIILYCSG